MRLEDLRHGDEVRADLRQQALGDLEGDDGLHREAGRRHVDGGRPVADHAALVHPAQAPGDRGPRHPDDARQLQITDARTLVQGTQQRHVERVGGALVGHPSKISNLTTPNEL